MSSYHKIRRHIQRYIDLGHFLHSVIKSDLALIQTGHITTADLIRILKEFSEHVRSHRRD